MPWYCSQVCFWAEVLTTLVPVLLKVQGLLLPWWCSQVLMRLVPVLVVQELAHRSGGPPLFARETRGRQHFAFDAEVLAVVAYVPACCLSHRNRLSSVHVADPLLRAL